MPKTLTSGINPLDNQGPDGAGSGVSTYPFKSLTSISTYKENYEEKTTAPQWIVIHNMGGSNKASECVRYFNSGGDGRKVSAHYCVDDKEIIQYLKDTWTGHHAGTPKPGQYGADKGCSNANSIGIEIADGPSCDKAVSMDAGIEVARYLMKKYNIPIENVIRHNDVSGKHCPQWIMENNKWDYFKEECKNRNGNDTKLKFDTSKLDQTKAGAGTNTDATSSGGHSNTPATVNFDNRDDWTNLKEVKGLILCFHPNINCVDLKDRDKFNQKYGITQQYHYMLQQDKVEPGVEKTKIAFCLQDNDRHTYIDRALFNNESLKYCLSIALYMPPTVKTFLETEKQLIDNVARILHENGLNPNHLWREFDINRAESPVIYLDRIQWKKFLRELDKQVDWRYQNFGNVAPPKEVDGSKYKGFSAIPLVDNCPVKGEPREQSNTVKAIGKSDMVKITDYKVGWYRIENPNGWVKAEFLKLIIPPSDSNPTEAYITCGQYTDNHIPKPEIHNTMTQEEYEEYMKQGTPNNIEVYASQFEPYDKGLPEIVWSPITDDDRMKALTQKVLTKNEVNINYAIVEGSTGDVDHCVVAAPEFNSIFKPQNTDVEPMYPDLIVPPKYTTSDLNIKDDKISLSAFSGAMTKEEEDKVAEQLFEKGYTFDPNLLKDKTKKSKGRPINYNDPYPYDDKIYELELHHPKVKIDEIESRIYACNHPGCPISQPLAKNFANQHNINVAQSVKTEQRLVRIENTLSMIMRNFARLASRMNVNCVYYGGQDNFGKYKSIRCLQDDRLHDGASVTIDQCLCCTRYEPIVGQIYEILDETGMNGSVLMDDMQMSYMSPEDFTNLNRVEKRSSEFAYADMSLPINDKPKTLIERWKQEDHDNKIAEIKKTTTNEAELKKKVDALKEDDYIFKMNWAEEKLELQEPDIKKYPDEGLKSQYKYKIGDPGAKEVGQPPVAQPIDPFNPDIKTEKELDEKIAFDLTSEETISKGDWSDTREKAETQELNKYSSEDYFFDGFATDLTLGSSNSTTGAGVGVIGCDARNKMVEMAKKILQEGKDMKACYSQEFRTTNYDQPHYGIDTRISHEKIKGYDCSSLVSCCYHYAGLSSLYNLTSHAQFAACKANGGETWEFNEEGIKKALPGDIVHIFHNGGGGHVAICIGDGKLIQACTKSYPTRPDIRMTELKDFAKDFSEGGAKAVGFGRPADLIAADKVAANTGAGGANPGNASFSGNHHMTANMTTQQFIEALAPAAMQGYKQFGLFASVCIAQAAEESGWGKSRLAYINNNLFGVKAFASWKGDKVQYSTGEGSGASAYRTNAWFRSYPSIEAGIADRCNFITKTTSYVEHGAFKASTPEEQIRALLAGGYMTGDQNAYFNSLMSIINHHNLKQYDKK